MNTISSPIWQLDEILLRGKNVYINGWIMSSTSKIRRIALRLTDSNANSVGEVGLLVSLPRPDVSTAYPNHQESFNSGFVGIGSWTRKPLNTDQLALQVFLDNGDSFFLEIPSDRWAWMLSPTSSKYRWAALKQWKAYLLKSWRFIRSGQFRMLATKFKRQLGDRPKHNINQILNSDVFSALGLSDGMTTHLILDHRLGGGANSYSQAFIDDNLRRGDAVLVLSYHIASLEFMLVVHTPTKREVFAVNDLFALPQILSGFCLSTITYNTGVSFADAEFIPSLLLRLREQSGATLTVLLHDYFIICPSHFLLNSQGQFCDIPSLAECRRCLTSNHYGFTSLFQGDVGSWRRAWGPLLSKADELVAFSDSSIALFRKAYEYWSDGENWLQSRSILLRPHKVSLPKLQSVKIHNPPHMVIGVVGQIGYHKGASIVQSLAAIIEKTKSSERISIIGNIELSVNPHIVSQTGPYRPDDLSHLVHKTGANIMLLPSIWPETFSYVTSELMELRLPLACLNLGAPAERVANYDKGLVLSSTCPEIILEELREFFKTTYFAQ